MKYFPVGGGTGGGNGGGGQPLRTRERAAVEVARKYLRAIIQSEHDDALRTIAANALIEMAKHLGERL